MRTIRIAARSSPGLLFEMAQRNSHRLWFMVLLGFLGTITDSCG
ncbi:hypothetical protein PRBEI_2000539100 [Prionailurus iriomotensis]